MKTILCFGDSLTAGYGVAPTHAYPALIQQKIEALDWKFRVVNAGISGDTTQDGLNRLHTWLQEPIDVFLLELGVNDLFRGVAFPQAKANLQAIVDRVKLIHPQAQQIMVGMEAPLEQLQLPFFLPQVERFRRMHRQLAEANDMAFVPFMLDRVAGQRHLNLLDGVHPNAAGYQLVAENIWTVLEDVLAQTRETVKVLNGKG
ncbi:acyl-CoA thioesterase-1 [Catalinimonas alkaloidigena]|uniref:Acyl-CoA thioesterase-1 n=1 Tax=Catalinimonas alkaloidigena TaxID=1075417 RepID=A0A1G9QKC3_9BACT|nr:arylesterase [Catalinimonas alkaloidigena]SDM11472.1 acyl-CoA thioesterase-1 [Catalinimonas alkaloidigena]